MPHLPSGVYRQRPRRPPVTRWIARCRYHAPTTTTRGGSRPAFLGVASGPDSYPSSRSSRTKDSAEASSSTATHRSTSLVNLGSVCADTASPPTTAISKRRSAGSPRTWRTVSSSPLTGSGGRGDAHRRPRAPHPDVCAATHERDTRSGNRRHRGARGAVPHASWIPRPHTGRMPAGCAWPQPRVSTCDEAYSARVPPTPAPSEPWLTSRWDARPS